MNESMDRALADWLREGPEHGPREALERVLTATRRTPQRPGWTIPERWLPMQLTLQRTPGMRPIPYLLLVALLIAALIAAAVFVGSRQRLPEPFGRAVNGVVAFERDGDILIADGPGGAVHTLVTGPSRDSRPVFSRQGAHVAFLRSIPDGGLMLMAARADGSNIIELGGPYRQHDRHEWSPDGSSIAVGWIRKGYFEISVVATNGSGETNLELDMPADQPTWRPDGSVLAFRGQPGDGGDAAAVYLVRPDGLGLKRLDLGSPEVDESIEFEGLTWSPDGTRLSYMRSVRIDGSLDWRIHVADISPTGDVMQIRRLALAPDSSAEMLGAWSPEGDRLAFILERAGTRQLAIAPVDGSTPARAIGPVVRDDEGIGGAWSPDGTKMLATYLPRQDPQTFWSIDVESGAQTQLEGPVADLPSWQRVAP